MSTKMQLGSQKLFLVFTVLSCCMSLEVSIPQKEYEVANGNDIMMTCNFIPARPNINLLILKWQYYPDNIDEPLKNVATFFSNNPTDIAPGYEGRAVLEVDITGQVSKLTLKKVTIQDSRNYQCSVIIPNDDEGITAATTSLLVLVPPSKPICQIQGKAEYWQDIILTCMSEQGSPKPVYEWTSYSVKNLPRPFPPKTNEKDGALSLFNISREMSGFFICMSTNRIGSASCNLTLSVMPGSMNIGATAGIVGGVLGGLLCLGILIFCCCRTKSKKDQYAEGSAREMEFFDSDAPEAGQQYRDDKSSVETKQKVNQYEDEDVPQKGIAGTARHRFEDDQQSYVSGRERPNAEGSDIDTQRYQGDQHDSYHGSHDRLEDQQDRYGGSREQLDDRCNYNSGSRDRLNVQYDRYRGSRDHLNDQRDRYGGSRDHLDEPRDRYGGSRDRLDEPQVRYGGSRDRLDDVQERYGGSRDRLDDRHNYNRGSCDRLNDQRDHYGGSRDRLNDYYYRGDRLDDQQGRYGGSRDHLDGQHNRYGGSRDHLDNRSNR